MGAELISVGWLEGGPRVPRFGAPCVTMLVNGIETGDRLRRFRPGFVRFNDVLIRFLSWELWFFEALNHYKDDEGLYNADH